MPAVDVWRLIQNDIKKGLIVTENNFRMSVRLRNNRLLKRREELKLTQKEMAMAVGISLQAYGTLECLAEKPIKEDACSYRWKKHAMAIADYFGCNPEELFPDEIININKPVVHREMSLADVIKIGVSPDRLVLESPENVIEKKELETAVSNSLDGLTEQEKIVIDKRFGLTDGLPLHLNAVGKLLGKSTERVRQIECRALRKLRYPKRAGLLKPFTHKED